MFRRKAFSRAVALLAVALLPCLGASECGDASSSPSGHVYYVDGASTFPWKDGRSWATAFSRIQPAIDACACVVVEFGGTCQVWVADGIYGVREDDAHDTIALASAGDSRMYEFHPRDGLVQLTTDHSFPAEFAREHGYLPPGSETMKNLIARAVGPRSELEPELHSLPRRGNSRFLLCSDGASGCVPAEELAYVMETAPTPRAAVNCVMRRALLAGARDNITVIAVFPASEGE